MNRIAKLREQQGLSQTDLARRVGTSQAQIARLEAGGRRLTEDWMRRIARVLDVSPADLLSAATRAEFDNELEPYLPEASNDLAKPLNARNLRYFRVLSHSVELAGVPRGAVVLVDYSPAAIEAIKTGNIVVAVLAFEGDHTVQVLRQFVAPALLTTNREGRNTSFSLRGEEFQVRLLGVVVRPEDQAA